MELKKMLAIMYESSRENVSLHQNTTKNSKSPSLDEKKLDAATDKVALFDTAKAQMTECHGNYTDPTPQMKCAR